MQPYSWTMVVQKHDFSVLVTTWPSWTWGFEKHLIHKTIGPPTKKNTKMTSKKHSFYTHYVWYKSRETLLNSGTRFHHMSNFQWEAFNRRCAPGLTGLFGLKVSISATLLPVAPQGQGAPKMVRSPVVDVDRIHKFSLKHVHFTARCHKFQHSSFHFVPISQFHLFLVTNFSTGKQGSTLGFQVARTNDNR